MMPSELMDYKFSNYLKAVNREEGAYVPTATNGNMGSVAWSGKRVVDVYKDSKAFAEAITCVFADMWTDVNIMCGANRSPFMIDYLGIDCPAEKVVETAKAEGIKIVALSGVLTLALDSMKTTVEALKAAGADCKVIIGGSPVSADACASIGADEWAYSPQKTVQVCKAWANA